MNSNEKGQGLAEYGLVIILVAVVVIAALVILGLSIGGMYSDINDEMPTVS